MPMGRVAHIKRFTKLVLPPVGMNFAVVSIVAVWEHVVDQIAVKSIT